MPTPIVGLGFYFLIATAGLVRAAQAFPLRGLFNFTATAASVLAFIFSAYLVYYQWAHVGETCTPCLASALLTTVLFLLHGYQARLLRLDGDNHGSDSGRERDFMAVLAFVGMAGLFAQLLFAGPRFSKPASQEGRPSITSPVPVAGGVKKTSTEKAFPAAKRATSLVPDEWLPESAAGVAKRGVSVIAFFDPNCSHCSDVFDTVCRLIPRFGDRVQISIQPCPLFTRSILQIQALEVARERGKYLEMWRLQFSHFKGTGLDREDIAALFGKLGENTYNLEADLDRYKSTVIKQREKVKAPGIVFSPAIFINGKVVASADRSEKSLTTAIEQALSAAR